MTTSIIKNKFIKQEIHESIDNTIWEKFQMVTSLVLNPIWWRERLAEGCSIGGGAALFILDQCACISDIGDIDLYVTCNNQQLTEYVENITEWFDNHNLPYKIHIRYSIVTIHNQIINIQIIKSRDYLPVDIINDYDFDAVQNIIIGDFDFIKHQNIIKYDVNTSIDDKSTDELTETTEEPDVVALTSYMNLLQLGFTSICNYAEKLLKKDECIQVKTQDECIQDECIQETKTHKIYYITSHDACNARATRIITYENKRQWKFKTVTETLSKDTFLKNRREKRLEKLKRKGYFTKKDKCYNTRNIHNCIIFHRNYDEKYNVARLHEGHNALTSACIKDLSNVSNFNLHVLEQYVSLDELEPTKPKIHKSNNEWIEMVFNKK